MIEFKKKNDFIDYQQKVQKKWEMFEISNCYFCITRVTSNNNQAIRNCGNGR